MLRVLAPDKKQLNMKPVMGRTTHLASEDGGRDRPAVGQVRFRGPHDPMALGAQVALGADIRKLVLRGPGVAKEGAKLEGQVHQHVVAQGRGPLHRLPAEAGLAQMVGTDPLKEALCHSFRALNLLNCKQR